QDYSDALRLGARMMTLDEVLARGVPAVVDEIISRVGRRQTYLTLDIDVVDPAFAPGTGTPEVGGLTSYQVLQLLRGLAGQNLIGADVVEVCPPFDQAHITSILAANLVFEVLSIMALQKSA